MSSLRAHSYDTDSEVNLVLQHIIAFGPHYDGRAGSAVHMSNGVTYNIDKSPRSVRYAIKNSVNDEQEASATPAA